MLKLKSHYTHILQTNLQYVARYKLCTLDISKSKYHLLLCLLTNVGSNELANLFTSENDDFRLPPNWNTRAQAYCALLLFSMVFLRALPRRWHPHGEMYMASLP